MTQSRGQQAEQQPARRSALPGELGACIDRSLAPDQLIVSEVETYRGHALVLTEHELLVIVGGALAGLKAHEQHVLRLAIDDITDLSLEPEKLGCISPFIGPPVINLQLTPAPTCTHDAKWNRVVVGFMQLGAAMRIIALIKYEQGRRQGRSETR